MQVSRHDESSAPVVPVQPARRRRLSTPVELYRSAVGKKWAMALSGVVLMGYVLAHMIGNLKMYMGAAELDHYAEWLRDLGTPALPRTVALWLMRSVLVAAFAVHVHAAWALTRMNRRAKPTGYLTGRDYLTATYAGRTMRWSGVIVGLFVIFHLMDLTWGNANPEFVRGDVYDNVVHSFSRVPVAAFYVAANVALAIHLWHGAWSFFFSLGSTHPRFNRWRRTFATAFAGVILVGNVSFPVMVQLGVVR